MNPGRVLTHLLNGLPVTVGGVEYRLSEDGDLCHQLTSTDTVTGEKRSWWRGMEMPLAGFIKLVESMTDEERFNQASMAALNTVGSRC